MSQVMAASVTYLYQQIAATAFSFNEGNESPGERHIKALVTERY